jgi:homoserine O-acetyltransferase
MKHNVYRFESDFLLESGSKVSALELFYCTSGTYINGKSRVVWVCHALTASADCESWWPDLIGKDNAIGTADDFVICVNIPSSCYGSTGPLSMNPNTGEKYYSDFPVFTVRDIVNAFAELRRQLNIPTIDILIGGSMGGYQCLEWAIAEPEVIRNLVLVATSARESAWGIAIHTSQRMAIETDLSFGERRDDAGARGLKTARAIGMLTYRSYQAFVDSQSDDDERTDNFKVSSYIHYQGEKLVNRFNAYSYWLLTKTMDSHNVGRNRDGITNALKKIQARTLCIGITTDFLCPIQEQRYLAANIPDAEFLEIDSPFGHDGFLVEGKKIGDKISSWY